jgi:hypothetical protein
VVVAASAASAGDTVASLALRVRALEQQVQELRDLLAERRPGS